MKLSLSDDSQTYLITAYAEGEFTVRGQILTGSQIIWPDRPPIAWSTVDINALNQDSFDLIATEDVEAIILGTGKKLVFPEDQWLEQFYKRSVGIEIMDTAAACRTYNILVSEGRNILAALLPV